MKVDVVPPPPPPTPNAVAKSVSNTWKDAPVLVPISSVPSVASMSKLVTEEPPPVAATEMSYVVLPVVASGALCVTVALASEDITSGV